MREQEMREYIEDKVRELTGVEDVSNPVVLKAVMAKLSLRADEKQFLTIYIEDLIDGRKMYSGDLFDMALYLTAEDNKFKIREDIINIMIGTVITLVGSMFVPIVLIRGIATITGVMLYLLGVSKYLEYVTM